MCVLYFYKNNKLFRVVKWRILVIHISVNFDVHLTVRSDGLNGLSNDFSGIVQKSFNALCNFNAFNYRSQIVSKDLQRLWGLFFVGKDICQIII